MRAIWRELLLVLAAWLCGRGSTAFFPAFPFFQAEQPGDWLSLLIFRPGPVVVSTALFLTSIALIFRIHWMYAKRWLMSARSFVSLRYVLVQTVVLGLSLFELTLQLLKHPIIATSLYGVLLISFYPILHREHVVKREVVRLKAECNRSD